MFLKPDLIPPQAPRLVAAELPEKERMEGLALSSNLDRLSVYYREYVATVVLFQQTQKEIPDPRSLVLDFAFCAAKCAIISIYNYRMAVDGIIRSFRSVRSWAKLMDRSSIEEERKRFQAEFPSIRELRQSILHQAELHWDAEQIGRNAVSKGHSGAGLTFPPGIQVMAEGNFSGSTYSANFNGEIYAIDLSPEKAITLRDITVNLFQSVSELPKRR